MKITYQWYFLREKNPLFPKCLKQGFFFSLKKCQNTPKIFAPSARIYLCFYKVYDWKTPFLRLLAPQAIFFSFYTWFRSDFAVKNDDFQRKEEIGSENFLRSESQICPKQGGVFSQRGGFFSRNTTDVGRIS